MFQPTRPPVSESSPLNCRATAKGGRNVVDAVPIMPMRLVSADRAPIEVIGS